MTNVIKKVNTDNIVKTNILSKNICSATSSTIDKKAEVFNLNSQNNSRKNYEIKAKIETTEYDKNKYKSNTYKKMLKRVIEKYNQIDGDASNYPVDGDIFKNVGCSTAALMMAYALFSGDFNFSPEKFIDDAVNQGYLSFDGGFTDALFVDSEHNLLEKNWHLKFTQIEVSDNPDEIKEKVIESLKKGKKVLFNVNVNDKFYDSTEGHYVLLDHYDEQTNQIYVLDPAAREGAKNPERTGYKDVEFLKENMFSVQNLKPVEIEYTK